MGSCKQLKSCSPIPGLKATYHRAIHSILCAAPSAAHLPRISQGCILCVGGSERTKTNALPPSCSPGHTQSGVSVSVPSFLFGGSGAPRRPPYLHHSLLPRRGGVERHGASARGPSFSLILSISSTTHRPVRGGRTRDLEFVQQMTFAIIF